MSISSRSVVAVVLLSATASVNAQLTVMLTGTNNMPTDVSADGSVVVGNIYGPYETFYWTFETGALPLGRATVPVIGSGAGTPDVSADGTKVSATVLTDDGLYATQGIWDITNGWQTLMPPSPTPDGAILDNSYGSAWGLSGDGNKLVGFYWTNTGKANPCVGDLVDGPIGLGPAVPGRSGRVNAANHDGTVVGGWTERTDGVWQPTVWIEGERSVLGNFEAFSQVSGVNSDGTVLVGDSYVHPNAGATIWRKNGQSWEHDYIGVLPGTAALNGLSWFSSVSDDGKVVVGANRWAFSPVYAGMVWTPDTGLMLADDWVAGLDATTPFPLVELTAVSQDGRTVVGIMQNTQSPFELAGVVMRCDSSGDADGDGDVDLQDAALFQQYYTGAGAGAIDPAGVPLDTNCDLDIDQDDWATISAVMGGPAR